MAITYTVSIPHLAQLQSAFKRAPDLTAKAVAAAINKSLAGYRATSKQLSPIETGRLRQSIQIQLARVSGNTVEASEGTNVAYAETQEAETGIDGPRHTEIVPRRAVLWASPADNPLHGAVLCDGLTASATEPIRAAELMGSHREHLRGS